MKISGDDADADTAVGRTRSSRLWRPDRSPLRRQLTDVALSYGVSVSFFGLMIAMNMSTGASFAVAIHSVLKWRYAFSAFSIGTMIYMTRRGDDKSARD